MGLESDLLKVSVNGLGWFDLKLRVNNVTEVIEVESGNLHHLLKEHAGVRGHLDLKEGHHDD